MEGGISVYVPPNVTNAMAKNTPASVKMSAGLLLRGGPGRESFLDQESGAGRVPVRIKGILASAISCAN